MSLSPRPQLSKLSNRFVKEKDEEDIHEFCSICLTNSLHLGLHSGCQSVRVLCFSHSALQLMKSLSRHFPVTFRHFPIMGLGNGFIWEIVIITSVSMIILCGIYPFISYYFSLHPFPRLFLPPLYKEHLSMGEIVAAIQSSSTQRNSDENEENYQQKAPLSSGEIEILTQMNTRRNSICQEVVELPAGQLGRKSRSTRHSLEMLGVCTTFNLHQITEENISRRKIQWNPLVTEVAGLIDEDSVALELEAEWTPLPSVHSPLMKIVPRGILRNHQRTPSPHYHSPRLSKKISLTLATSDDRPVEETLNPLFPVSKKHSSSSYEGQQQSKDESGWKKRMESYEVYRAKAPHRHLSFSHRRETKSANGYSQFDELIEVAPSMERLQGPPKIRRHSHNAHSLRNNATPSTRLSPSLLQVTLGRQQQCQTHGNSTVRLSQDSKRSTKRYYSPPPARYDERGQRIIELEELESPHHPIWIGVDDKERIAYEKEFGDHGKEGGGGDVYLMGVIGREEGKMIGGKFKEIV
jgi:hypothetical protein